ncbi:MAG: hypothetical protein IGS23_12600 [Rivularia sp. T60_A2020_040]|nr:hypothetical protein [Rivularia sp. T60_A2020_040]
MFKQINKLISPPLAVPLLGLVIAIGAISQRAQPVLSKQIYRLQATTEKQVPTITWMENSAGVASEGISKEARLRRVLDSSSSESPSAARVSPGETYTWIQRNTTSEGFAEEIESLSTTQAKISEDKASIKGAIPRTNFPDNNGVFLYGASRQTGQFGKGYIIFEKVSDRVVGAMYMPASEFNCFQGTLDSSGEIAMTVKGYAGDVNPTQVASRYGLPQSNEDNFDNYAYSVTLQDYYQLDNIGDDERRILKACKANFQ